MQSPEETFFVQEPHVVLRRGRRMLLEGRAQGFAHQPHALRSTERGEARDAGGGMPFCMTQMEDAMKARSMEEKMRVRDISELIADSTGAVDSK
jgi:hypothetical protein